MGGSRIKYVSIKEAIDQLDSLLNRLRTIEDDEDKTKSVQIVTVDNFIVWEIKGDAIYDTCTNSFERLLRERGLWELLKH